ncbi:hypothetical protein [Corallococcus macrosporus]|uniref:Primosomal protein N' (Replication factor Y)-superfamily II helicase n=1 Tax=Corallococcus macrosporus DSM 14697 TaxID=1189310 RepID=A0A286NW86_9BACT|nr:hypothetical protein [Corallococcus macrosporus]ATB51431.1 hypothetical protein MYMAC_007094 [Corallococcus macrosporus DSM 14697]
MAEQSQQTQSSMAGLLLHLECQSCGARLVLEPALRTTRCPYCAAPAVVERPPVPGVPEPVFALGFALTHTAAQEHVARWLRSRSRFTRSGIRSAAPGEVRGVYVPAYLYSVLAQARYRASIGENYQETETYAVTDEDGKTHLRTRTVTRVEWRPLEGELASYVADVLVTASKGLENAELEALEPFDLRGLARYTPALISGWVAEEPSLTLARCQAQARSEAVDRVRGLLSRFMPGDSHKDLVHQSRLDWEALDVCLLPVWVLAVKYAEDAPPLRVLVNGQTGAVHGKAPISPWKVLAAVVTLLAVLAMGGWFMGGGR